MPGWARSGAALVPHSEIIQVLARGSDRLTRYVRDDSIAPSLACLGRLGGDMRLPGRPRTVQPGKSSGHHEAGWRRLRAAFWTIAIEIE